MKCDNCFAELSQKEQEYLERQNFRPLICFRCIRSLNGLEQSDPKEA